MISVDACIQDCADDEKVKLYIVTENANGNEYVKKCVGSSADAVYVNYGSIMGVNSCPGNMQIFRDHSDIKSAEIDQPVGIPEDEDMISGCIQDCAANEKVKLYIVTENADGNEYVKNCVGSSADAVYVNYGSIMGVNSCPGNMQIFRDHSDIKSAEIDQPVGIPEDEDMISVDANEVNVFEDVVVPKDQNVISVGIMNGG